MLGVDCWEGSHCLYLPQTWYVGGCMFVFDKLQAGLTDELASPGSRPGYQAGGE